MSRAVDYGVQNFSTSQDRSSDADVLKLELEEVLAILQHAEALSG